eukprot:5774217-Prymnesium_polylepis.4
MKRSRWSGASLLAAQSAAASAIWDSVGPKSRFSVTTTGNSTPSAPVWLDGKGISCLSVSANTKEAGTSSQVLAGVHPRRTYNTLRRAARAVFSGPAPLRPNRAHFTESTLAAVLPKKMTVPTPSTAHATAIAAGDESDDGLVS